MIAQRRFAPKGGRIKPESVAGYAGISSKLTIEAESFKVKKE